MVNKGKMFESDFKKSCERQGVWVWRLSDSYVSAKAADENAFVPRQPCDYVVHYEGEMYLCELKTTDKKFITVEHDGVKGMIKEHQWQGMRKLSGEHEHGYLVLQFMRDSEEQMTYAIGVEDFEKFLKESGKHSINALDVVQHRGKILQQHKLRTHWVYNVLGLLKGE